jgi:hypothetical protein
MIVARKPPLAGLLTFALALGTVASCVSFFVLAFCGMNLNLIQFDIIFPGQHPPPIAPREYATWVMIAGLSISVGWATARFIFNFVQKLAGSGQPN